MGSPESADDFLAAGAATFTTELHPNADGLDFTVLDKMRSPGATANRRPFNGIPGWLAVGDQPPRGGAHPSRSAQPPLAPTAYRDVIGAEELVYDRVWLTDVPQHGEDVWYQLRWVAENTGKHWAGPRSCQASDADADRGPAASGPRTEIS